MICIFHLQLVLPLGRSLDFGLRTVLPAGRPAWNKISTDEITLNRVISIRNPFLCKWQQINANQLLQNWTYWLIKWKNPGVVLQAQLNPEAQIIWNNLFLFCFSLYWLFSKAPCHPSSPTSSSRWFFYAESVHAAFLASVFSYNIDILYISINLSLPSSLMGSIILNRLFTHICKALK